ncbi:probable serine/threonine-protein kinase DDB_G0282963 isoform X2 [Condylostylus longicornis]|uniref:probable serine/threonine-protein kinase DDB_G0282963 isoform X2 n=1 Tax=Condylostylus longicornis TaxID=2530218 RepID=UPI00244E2831|nr:probable serine/threonine-protein kinase DDB_G0282963 isoform X2 [Condylostylus longicornis]
MIDPYIQQVLRVIVAQICQTIGWHSIQTTPLELLVDILHKYLHEITRNVIRYTELYNRIEPNLDDVGLAFRELNINLNEIEEYVNYVQPVPCNIDIPKFPVHKDSNLNFLKPGSKEVITRPMYIPEHLPPIYPEREEETLEKQLEICDTTTDNIIEINSNKIENKNDELNKSDNENNFKHSENDQHMNTSNNNIKLDIENVTGENIDNDKESTNTKESLINTASINENTLAIEASAATTKTENDFGSKSAPNNLVKSPVSSSLVTTTSTCVISTVDSAILNTETSKIMTPSQNTLSAAQNVSSITTSNVGTINGQNLSKFIRPRLPHETEGRPTREISSVMMTSSGFISPAREGKLPDSKIPMITEPRVVRSPSPPLLSTIGGTNSKVINTSKQIPQVSSTTSTSLLIKSGHQNLLKLEKNNIQSPNVSTPNLNTSTNNNKSIEKSQYSNCDSKYLKKLKRKNLLALEKEHRKLEKINNSIPVSKQLFLQKQQQKIFKQQQKQLLKLQKQKKQQQNHPNPGDTTIESFTAQSGSKTTDTIISDSDLIMPSSVVLPDGRNLKLSKKHKGTLRKQRELLLSIIQSRKNSKEETSILNSNIKNGVSSVSNTSFNNNSSNDVMLDKQTLTGMLNQTKQKQQNAIDPLIKSTSIIAQQQALVAQLAVAGSNINELQSNIFNQTGSILPSTFSRSTSSLKTSTNSNISAVNLPNKQNIDDIKIINESDKTKINSYKKLPSIKNEINESTTIPLDQFIHLPSGTTITPAPDSISPPNLASMNVQNVSKSGTIITQIGRPLKLPTDTDQIICIDDDDNNINSSNNKATNDGNNNSHNKNVSVKSDNISPRLQFQQQNNENNVSSKQIVGMNPPMLMVSSSSNNQGLTKIEKKLKRKRQQNEPLNLSSDKIAHCGLLNSANIGSSNTNSSNKNDLQEFYLEQQMRIQQQYAIATKLMKKERKKPKLKEKRNIQSNLNQQQSSAAAAVLAAAHQQYIQNLAVVAAAASSSVGAASSGIATPSNSSSSRDISQPIVRSAENLAAINKKLMKIDTVMQPAPSVLQSNTNNNLILQSQSTNNSPNLQKLPQKTTQQPQMSAAANTLASLTFPYPPFPYTFPSRPGLIPSPGIFPPLATANLVDKLLPIMPFSKFNSLKSTNSTLDEINKLNSNNSSNTSSSKNIATQQLNNLDLEKNYCTVAPLVPESMIQNFKLSTTKDIRHSNYQVGKNFSNKVASTLQNSNSNNPMINFNELGNNINDTPIEISDDEKIRSDSEEKLSQSFNKDSHAGINQNSQLVTTSILKEESLLCLSENRNETATIANNDSLLSKNINNDLRVRCQSDRTIFSNTITSTIATSVYNNNESNNINNNNSNNNSNTDIHKNNNNQNKIENVNNDHNNENNLFNAVNQIIGVNNPDTLSVQKHEKRKEHHKKSKKTKDGKIKKKKEKKDKSKNKEKSDKKKDKEDRIRYKEKLKKQKKEKKKEKLRQLSVGSTTSITSGGSSVNVHDNSASFDSNAQMKSKYSGIEDTMKTIISSAVGTLANTATSGIISNNNNNHINKINLNNDGINKNNNNNINIKNNNNNNENTSNSENFNSKKLNFNKNISYDNNNIYNDNKSNNKIFNSNSNDYVNNNIINSNNSKSNANDNIKDNKTNSNNMNASNKSSSLKNIDTENLNNSNNSIPKLTLILGNKKSPAPTDSNDNNTKKSSVKFNENIEKHYKNELINNSSNKITSNDNKSNSATVENSSISNAQVGEASEGTTASSSITLATSISIDQNIYKRELSPELARISPLVTRPPKQKSKEKDKVCDIDITSSSSTPSAIASSLTSTATSPVNSTLINSSITAAGAAIINSNQQKNITSFIGNPNSINIPSIQASTQQQQHQTSIVSSSSLQGSTSVAIPSSSSILSQVQHTAQVMATPRGPGRPKGSGNKQNNSSGTGSNSHHHHHHHHQQNQQQQQLQQHGHKTQNNNNNQMTEITTTSSSTTLSTSNSHNQHSNQQQVLSFGSALASSITPSSSAVVGLGGSGSATSSIVGSNNGGYISTTTLSSLTTQSISGGNPSRLPSINSTDADGNQVWICPACGRVDDGTPMIGCDGCDAWYHWVCVGIQVPPDDNEDWYCRVCIAKKQATHESDKKKKRKKKSKQTN